MHVSLKLGLLVLACFALGACRHGRVASCPKPGVYAQAGSIPPLRIPSGLQAPDTRGALRIPDLNEPEQPLPKVAPCLDQPPRYSPNAKLTNPDADKKARKRLPRGKDKAPPPAAPGATSAPPTGTTP